MKIFSAPQIRAWDQATIQNEPIPSLDLMERAAGKCADWILEHLETEERFSIFAGTGNNGGDGLAIGRMLLAHGKEVILYILGDPENGSDDFKENYKIWKQTSGVTHILDGTQSIDANKLHDHVIIDSIFGSGLDRPVEGWRANIITTMNAAKSIRIAIDTPSGIPADPNENMSSEAPSIDAHFTLTFQRWKRSFYQLPALQRCGEVVVLDIGLDASFTESEFSDWMLIDRPLLYDMVKERDRNGHKGTFGKVLIVAGSKGMMGAAQLAMRAALQSGCGLVQCHVPGRGEKILQAAIPEAVVQIDANDDWVTNVSIDQKVTGLAIGPGLGTNDSTALALEEVLETKLPAVIDADALNLIGGNESLRSMIEGRGDMILTPHPGEFDRLFGEHRSDTERVLTAQQEAKALNCIICLKGRFTKIFTPEGKVWVNPFGSPSLAIGGSGDVLTGLMGGLLASGRNPEDSAILAVAMHGRLGELYEETYGTQGLTAGWLADHIRMVWKRMRSKESIDGATS